MCFSLIRVICVDCPIFKTSLYLKNGISPTTYCSGTKQVHSYGYQYILVFWKLFFRLPLLAEIFKLVLKSMYSLVRCLKNKVLLISLTFSCITSSILSTCTHGQYISKTSQSMQTFWGGPRVTHFRIKPYININCPFARYEGNKNVIHFWQLNIFHHFFL